MSFADEKLALRIAVHATFSVAATYYDSTLPAPVNLAVRWHAKEALPYGDIGNDGYAEVLSRIHSLIFDRTALATAGVRLRRGGRVTLPGGSVFVLDVEEPRDGPVTAKWSVTLPPRNGESV